MRQRASLGQLNPKEKYSLLQMGCATVRELPSALVMGERARARAEARKTNQLSHGLT